MPDPPEFAAFASLLPVGILRSSLEGRYSYVSERVTDLTGVTVESALESGWEQCVHPDDCEAVLHQVSSARNARKPWQGEFRCVLPDGRIRWLLGQATPEHNLQGHVVGFVWTLTGLDLDITERRRAEEALQARRDEERDRELRLLLETATQGIVSVDAAGDDRDGESRARSDVRLGAGGADWPVDRAAACPGQFVTRTRSIGPGTSPHRVPGRWVSTSSSVGQRKDGSTFPIEVSLNHVADAGGGHAIAFVTDITERKRAAAALQERTVELEHRTAQLSRLASDLTLAEQHAREQLAKTLHDGLQQLLVSAALNLESTRDAGSAARGRSGRTARAGERSPRRGDRCRTIAEPGAVSSRAARFGIARGVDLAGRADTKPVRSGGPGVRRPARQLRPEGRPHAVVRVGARAPVQRGQARPGRSGHDRSVTRSG